MTGKDRIKIRHATFEAKPRIEEFLKQFSETVQVFPGRQNLRVHFSVQSIFKFVKKMQNTIFYHFNTSFSSLSGDRDNITTLHARF